MIAKATFLKIAFNKQLTTNLHVSDLVLFPLILLHLVLVQLHPGPHEDVVVAAVHLQLPEKWQ